ncbi:MAG TPA: hypothetical protein PKK95_04015 [Vicinamibacterales bacterium]|nr:hypothetical protein [Vicinamibacterales bacterium]
MAEAPGTTMAEGGKERGKGGDGEPEKAVVAAYRGFFPVVYGNDVEVKQGGGAILIARDELEIEQGGGQCMIGLRKLEVEQGGCALMVAGRAQVDRGLIGILLAGKAELGEGTRVLLTVPQAIAAGVAAGAIVALASLLRADRGRGRRPRPEIAGSTTPGI